MKTASLIDFEAVAHLVSDPIARAVAKPIPHESETFLSSYARIPVYSRPDMEAVKFLSAARRVEASLLAAMGFEVVHNLKGLTRFDEEKLKHDFVTAMEQMVLGEPMKVAEKLSRRMIKTAQQLMHGTLGGFFSEAPGLSWEKIGMVVYSLACDLTADGTFILVEGSIMATALEELKGHVLTKLHPKQVASAEKQAIHFRTFLAEREYFL